MEDEYGLTRRLAKDQLSILHSQRGDILVMIDVDIAQRDYLRFVFEKIIQLRSKRAENR